MCDESYDSELRDLQRKGREDLRTGFVGPDSTRRTRRPSRVLPRQPETGALWDVALKLARARNARQVAEVLQGVVQQFVPFHVMAVATRTAYGHVEPILFYRLDLTASERATLRQRIEREIRTTLELSDDESIEFRERSSGTHRLGEPPPEADREFVCQSWPLATRDETVGVLLLLRADGFTVPPTVRRLLDGVFTLTAKDLARLRAVEAERNSLVTAIVQSDKRGVLWIAPRRGRVILNRAASLTLDLPEHPRLVDVEARLRQVSLWGNLFGPATGDQIFLTRPVTLQDGRPYQVELLRVRDEQRLLVGSLLRLHDVGTAEQARARAGMTNTLAHELKTPLAAIQGYAGLMLEGVEGRLTDGQRHCAQNIADASTRTLALLTRFLESARIQGQAVRKRPVATADLFEPLLSEFEYEIQQKGLIVEHRIDAGAGTLYVDADQILILLRNLLSNAIKYTPPGGRIAVTATVNAPGVGREEPRSPHRKTTTLSLRRSYLELAVADTGPGIPEAEQERIFQPFERIPQETSGAPPGSGLGLSIALDIVEAHGGTLRVDSAPGKGTRFRAFLPASFRFPADGFDD